MEIQNDLINVLDYEIILLSLLCDTEDEGGIFLRSVN
jgi:hypothetical protein